MAYVTNEGSPHPLSVAKSNFVCDDLNRQPCAADTEAKRLAKQLVDGHAVELWQEARMVERFKPEE